MAIPASPSAPSEQWVDGRWEFCFINDTEYSITRSRVRRIAKSGSFAHSKGGAFETTHGGTYHAEISIECILDAQVNPFDTPVLMYEGNIVHLQLGHSSNANPWDGYVRVTEVEEDMPVDGVHALTFTGTSHGKYNIWSGTFPFPPP